MEQHSSIHWWFGPIATILGIVAIAGLIYTSIEGVFSYDDGIRHFTLAQMLGTKGIDSFSGWGDFLYSGYFSQHNIDPWFLSHVALIPLTTLGLIISMKVYVLLTMILLCATFLSIARSLRLSSRVASMFMMILLLEYTMFYARLHLARPYVLILLIAIGVLWCTIHRKIYRVCALLALGTLLSNLFLIPLIFASWGCIWLWCIGERKTGVHLALLSLTGVGVGIVLHPDSLDYARYLCTVFYQAVLFSGIDRPAEMQSGIDIVGMPAAMVGLSTLWLVAAMREKRTTMAQLHSSGVSLIYITACLLLVLSIAIARTIDFAWPVTVLLMMITIAIDPHAPGILSQAIFPRSVCKKWIFLSLLFLFPIISMGKMYVALQESGGYSPETAAIALENIPSETKVLNIDWDLFSLLFSSRQDLRYARGIDPTFDFIFDEKKARLFDIPLHSNSEYIDWHKWLLDLFDAYEGDYLALWNPYHPDLVDHIREFPELKMHFEGDENGFTIFRIDRALRANARQRI
ncbi:MAG: hypothetical protein O2904_02810 [bacterium]|nr:hypothetical protein [bacterium]